MWTNVPPGPPSCSCTATRPLAHLVRRAPPPVRLGPCPAPDLIGTGEPGRPALTYRFTDHAEGLDAWIEALGLGEAVFVLRPGRLARLRLGRKAPWTHQGGRGHGDVPAAAHPRRGRADGSEGEPVHRERPARHQYRRRRRRSRGARCRSRRARSRSAASPPTWPSASRPMASGWPPRRRCRSPADHRARAEIVSTTVIARARERAAGLEIADIGRVGHHATGGMPRGDRRCGGRSPRTPGVKGNWRERKEALVDVTADQGPYPSKTSGFAASGAAARTGIEPDRCPRRQLAFGRLSAVRAELYQTPAHALTQPA